jgi:pimeloyl-ACP methyl ester carboxylesterase
MRDVTRATAPQTMASRWRLWSVLACALIVLLLVGNAYVVDAKTRSAMARDGDGILDTPVVEANVKVEGDGHPIVLIHGFGAAMDWWDDIAPTLANDHRVVRIDLIGHGTAAPVSGYTIERQASLVTSTSSASIASSLLVIPWAARSRPHLLKLILAGSNAWY